MPSLRNLRNVMARNEAIQKHNVLDCFTAFAMTFLQNCVLSIKNQKSKTKN
jgi:hypothetical protein